MARFVVPTGLTKDEQAQRTGVTVRGPWRRIYEVARYHYNVSDVHGPVVKAHAAATAIWKTARGKRILFFPEEPWPFTSIFKVCLYGGHRIITNPTEPHDGAFKWWDATFTPNATIGHTFPRGRVMNLMCEDISKSRVDRIFAETFGYTITVDPTTHRGPCVEKSEENATHDGRIIDCPIDAPRPGYVYQKLINNLMDDGAYGTLRVPIFCGVIPYVALGHRPLDQRFGDAARSTFLEPTDAFSSPELEKLIEFSAKMNLDYGEHDVMRDRDDGRIYVCDVNPTPAGGTALRRLSMRDQREALSRLARCLKQMLEF